VIRQGGSFLSPNLPRLRRNRLLLPKRKRGLLPRRRHLHHLPPAHHQGVAGDLHRRSGTRHPLTKIGSPIPLHPNAGGKDLIGSREDSDSKEMIEEEEEEEEEAITRRRKIGLGVVANG
jgi:hypothetical protein